MNRALSILVTLAWGVWAGSLVGLFAAVTALGRSFGGTSLFGVATAGVFALYERVQLAVAGAALVLAFAWRLRPGAAGLKTAVFVTLALPAAAAVTETLAVAPRIDKMRVEGQVETDRDRFRTLHGLSMGLYGGSLLVLAAGGVLLPLAIAREARDANGPLGSRAERGFPVTAAGRGHPGA